MTSRGSYRGPYVNVLRRLYISYSIHFWAWCMHRFYQMGYLRAFSGVRKKYTINQRKSFQKTLLWQNMISQKALQLPAGNPRSEATILKN